MPKAHSPVRLEQDLMNAAAIASVLHHRSATEQVEYWADIGRKVSNVISPEGLLAVQAGLSRISLEDTPTVTPNPDDVFASLAIKISTGETTKEIQSQSLRYQASTSHPGLLEQISPNGSTLVGEFKDGAFKETIFA